MLNYLYKVFDQIQRSRENPIIQYSKPWKLSKGKRWSAIGVQLGAWLLVMLFLLAFSNTPFLDYCYRFQEWELYVLFVGISSLLTTANLLILSYRPSSPVQLRELELTRLNRRDAAFGAVYWATFANILLSIPCLLILHFLKREMHLRETPFPYLILTVIYWICLLGISIRGWLAASRRVWVQLTYSLLGAGLMGFFLIYLPMPPPYYILSTFMIPQPFHPPMYVDKRNPGVHYLFSDNSFVIFHFIISILLLLFWIRQAGRSAGNRYFVSLDLEYKGLPSNLANEVFLKDGGRESSRLSSRGGGRNA